MEDWMVYDRMLSEVFQQPGAYPFPFGSTNMQALYRLSEGRAAHRPRAGRRPGPGRLTVSTLRAPGPGRSAARRSAEGTRGVPLPTYPPSAHGASRTAHL
jgi:hypothetical protein